MYCVVELCDYKASLRELTDPRRPNLVIEQSADWID